MQKKQPPKILVLVFVLLGVYFVLFGIFPVTLEIVPTEMGMQGHIHRKAMFPPFKNVDIIIPNLKQASINSSRSSKGQTTYRVELEDFQGYRFPITSVFSSGYSSKVRLQDRINDTIRNRTEFRYSFNQVFFTLFGGFFIIVSLMSLVAAKKAKNNTYQQSRPRQDQVPKETPENFKRPQDFSIPQQTQQPESEEEKYKDINDSIIK